MSALIAASLESWNSHWRWLSVADRIQSLATRAWSAYALRRDMAQLEALPFDLRKDIGWPASTPRRGRKACI